MDLPGRGGADGAVRRARRARPHLGARLENDVYFQVGLVTLVGLAAKNAILICEFAIERVHHGMCAARGGIEAAGLRLRAIVMTSFAFIWVACRSRSRPGRGEQLRAIGHRLIGGMLFPTLIAISRTALLRLLESMKRASGERRRRRRGQGSRMRNGKGTELRVTVLCVAAGALLSACRRRPDYKRPEIEAPKEWRIDYPQAAEVANTKWWEQFGDPVLKRACRAALRENLDLQAAAARVDQFLGALTTTRSQFFPQFGYSGEASRKPREPGRPTPIPAG